jgi:hypothetical protein
MGATGLSIWFKLGVTKFLPRWIVDVALTIHYYEAILACLAILVWHFYHVIFDPEVYPFNWACWKGKVSKEWQQEEHPAAAEVPSNLPRLARSPHLAPASANNGEPREMDFTI